MQTRWNSPPISTSSSSLSPSLHRQCPQGTHGERSTPGDATTFSLRVVEHRLIHKLTNGVSGVMPIFFHRVGSTGCEQRRVLAVLREPDDPGENDAQTTQEIPVTRSRRQNPQVVEHDHEEAKDQETEHQNPDPCR